MARIWRPGQSRPVRLYRLVTCGGLEERMFQRQAAKLALSHSTLDAPWDESPSLSDANTMKRSGVLTREELRDLFQSPSPEWVSWTHELIECSCQESVLCSSPSLSTDSDAPADPNPESETIPDEDESDERWCQLGPTILGKVTQSSVAHKTSKSESLAYLLNWTHSLSERAIAALGDPLLIAPVVDANSNTWPVCAVFSKVT
ncbi:unnamed protein product [Echinostoma caproni]|uniref:SNF2_N domain-containing protein n=1 Tax=Echinostoma caproni TaxID=27848 RepID=A0A183ATZ2_9TREM|nr:unnamed protein product [Echinostoma caproni]